MDDRLLKFVFAEAPVRGEVVRLDDAWRRMIAHHDYPAPVLALLGQMTAAVALLAASIKFNGALILQIHGDGPVRLLVAECQPGFGLRATAKLEENAVIDDAADLMALVNTRGEGRCAITLDPRDRLPGQQPYQGVVSLDGTSIATVLETYMQQSEQLDTRLWLAADGNAAAGVLLQKLPREGGRAGEAGDTDAWPRAQMLADTLTTDELVSVPADALLQRLFWQERLVPGEPARPHFACNCSRSRIGQMLRALGRDEIDAIIAERGNVEVTCDFCNARQQFDAIDAAHLFATGETGAPPAGSMH